MQMREYPRTTTYDPSDIILIDKEIGGTKQLQLGDLVTGGNDPALNTISDVEQSMSTKRYGVGSYLIFENTFYEVIQPIAIGETLVKSGANANIRSTKISAELLKIVAKINQPLSVEMRRIMYRGKNLGATVTNAQKTAIQNGTFDDLFLDDYWTINGVKWLIADFDYWLNCGDIAFSNHHLVIVPEKNLYDAKMNSTNITTGGYVGSEMYTTNLAQAKTIISNAFGSMVKSHRELLVNATSNGYSSGGIWADSTVDLMNEVMVYGSYHMVPGSNGSVIPYRCTINNSQLALFMVNPKMIKTRESYWLRDVVSAAAFAFVGSGGGSYYINASGALGVRPVFAIG